MMGKFRRTKMARLILFVLGQMSGLVERERMEKARSSSSLRSEPYGVAQTSVVEVCGFSDGEVATAPFSCRALVPGGGRGD